MFIFKNRRDFREHLEHLMKITKGQRGFLTRKKDHIRQDGIEYGLSLTLEALAEWEKQQPDPKPSPPLSETHPCEGPEGAVLERK